MYYIFYMWPHILLLCIHVHMYVYYMSCTVATVAMHTVPDLRNLRNLTTAIITILP